MSVTQQVGGTHYGEGLGHWDIAERFDLGYLEGNATKYVDRWRHKGVPVLDLGKAISYLDRIAEEGRGARRLVPRSALAAWFQARNTDPDDRMVIAMIIGEGYGSPGDLEEARHKLQLMLDELEKRR